MTVTATGFTSKVRNYFDFRAHSATFKKEIIGGLATFMAMAYILAVNPAILSGSSFGGGSEYAGVFFLGTAISSMAATIVMGLYAKVPVAMAPGMGINAFFAYTVAGTLGLTIEQALVTCFCSGVLYVIVAVTPLRTYLTRLIPKNVKLAIGAMIGLFLAYIGLSDAGIIVSGAQLIPLAGQDATTLAGNAAGISTATKLGNFADPFVIIALVTMAIAFILHFAKIPGSALIAMLCGVIMVAIAFGAKVTDAEKAFQLQNYQSFGNFGKLSKGMWTSFGSTLSNGKAYIAIFVFLYINFFDTAGTLYAIDEHGKIAKNFKGDWMKRANIVGGSAATFGSIMLTSTTTAFVESTVGVSQGARTGFSSLIVGGLFAVAIAAWPIMTPVLPIAHLQQGVGFQSGTVMPVTGPILVIVGALMITQLKVFGWKEALDIPMLFVTFVIGMLSYSISAGIAAGVIAYYITYAGAFGITYLRQRFHKHVNLEDDDLTDHSADSQEARTKARAHLKASVLNPVMIGMLVLAVAYFATLPLYAY